MSDNSKQLLDTLLEEHDPEQLDPYAAIGKIAYTQPALAEIAVETLVDHLETEFEEYVESGAARQSEGSPASYSTNYAANGSKRTISLCPDTSLTRIPWELYKFCLRADSPPDMTAAIEPLSRLMTVSDPTIRCHALPALSVIGTRSGWTQVQTSLGYLSTALNSEIPEERALALWGITECCIVAPEMIDSSETIRTRLVDTRQYVRTNAADALLLLLSRGHIEPEANRREILSLVDSESPLSRDTVGTIAELGLLEAYEQISDELTQSYSTGGIRDLLEGHGIINDLLPSLEMLSESQAPADRLVAAATLGIIGTWHKVDEELHNGALESLNRLYTDENEAVRRVVRWIYNEGPHAWSGNVDLEGSDGEERTVDATRITVRLPAGVPETPQEVVQSQDFDLTGNCVEPGDIVSLELSPDVIGVEPPDTDDSEYAVYDVPIEVTETIPEGPVTVRDSTIMNTDSRKDVTADDWRPEKAVSTKEEKGLGELFGGGNDDFGGDYDDPVKRTKYQDIARGENPAQSELVPAVCDECTYRMEKVDSDERTNEFECPTCGHRQTYWIIERFC